VLPTELQAVGPLPEQSPENYFGQGHLAAQRLRISRRRWLCFRRYVFEQGPSTVLTHGPPPRGKLGEDLIKSEQMTRLRFVVLHMGNEGVKVVELLLVADEGVQADLDLAAVEIAVEVEQMRLEQLLRR